MQQITIIRESLFYCILLSDFKNEQFQCDHILHFNYAKYHKNSFFRFLFNLSRTPFFLNIPSP